MKTEFADSTLTLFLSGKVDATNAAAVEAEMNAACQAHPGCTLVVDAEDLLYISSAGLRVLLRLRKQNSDMTVVNVSRDVYDILEVTGFTDILNVKKALRKVSVEGCEKIGEGFNGAVYRLDAETIVKTYKPRVTMENILKEQHSAKYAFTMGIPTAISYDVVQVGENLGVVYELLNADVVSHSIMSDRENGELYMHKFADLAREMHTTDIAASDLPSYKELYRRKLERALPYLTEEEKEACLKIHAAIPEGTQMLHGDFHPKNVMLQNGEMMLIDMGDISKGHPLMEVMHFYGALPGLAKAMPQYCMQYIGLDADMCIKGWEWFKKYYFAGVPEEQTKLLETAAGLESCYSKLLSTAMTPNSVLRPRMSAALLLNADTLVKLLPMTAAIVEKSLGL